MSPPRKHVRMQVPKIQLSGKAEAAYVRNASAALAAARLNNYYPDARKASSHIGCLAPGLHRGLYPGLEIDLRSGLPTYREWTRAQTDTEMASQFLAQLRAREVLEKRARANPASIYGKQLLKHDYYEDIQDRQLIPLSRMEVALRRVVPETSTASFRVVLDKLDVSGLFVRYTVDLSQVDSAWNCTMVTLTDETAEHTEELKSLIYRVTAVDAEFMFTKLAAVGGLQVERVVKGTIGPFFFGGIRTPDGLRSMIKQDRDLIATFSLDTAACDQSDDLDNDPLRDLMEQQLSEKAREIYEKARKKFGYKVFIDRKFVVSESLVEAVDGFCREAGTRNIIYTLER